MLESIGAAPGSHSDTNWFQTWKDSPEYAAVQTELQRLKEKPADLEGQASNLADHHEFAVPFYQQLFEVCHRVFQQYWRTPSYIYSKIALCVGISLFIGFCFYNAPNTIQGLQNQTFAVFNLLTVFGQLVQQTMPYFVVQRDLYEVRERPSKVYSWQVFIWSQIIVEIPWNSLMALFMFVCFYYPIGLDRNAQLNNEVAERGGLMFLLLWGFMMFTSTFTDFIIAGFETAEAGGNIANVLFMLCLMFCGILASPDSMPRFWIFLYRVSPFTYMTSSMIATAVANSKVECASVEFMQFAPLLAQRVGSSWGLICNRLGDTFGMRMRPTCARSAPLATPMSISPSPRCFIVKDGGISESSWCTQSLIWAVLSLSIGLRAYRRNLARRRRSSDRLDASIRI
uniref:ABC-2 type transporter transmembrane domain-containing protein n=1 Tax=Bionectria ochroleuca TaxID=29856 RepID=A0A8H7NBG0_BIOOC